MVRRLCYVHQCDGVEREPLVPVSVFGERLHLSRVVEPMVIRRQCRGVNLSEDSFYPLLEPLRLDDCRYIGGDKEVAILLP